MDQTMALLPLGLDITWILLAGILGFGIGRILPRVLGPVVHGLTRQGDLLTQMVDPYQNWVGLVVALAAADLAVLVLGWERLQITETALSLLLALSGVWLLTRLLKQFFDVYLINAIFRSGRKTNSELFIVSKFIANFVIVVLGIILFAQTHRINVVGLFASLGIGGLAIAFAAQRTLEQLLGGIVLYVDRPFVVDDYIGLPDGTFGRVESIGLRSTRIRVSGKGTLMVVPNGNLNQMNIENFTGAKKVMSILYLTFYRELTNEEKALIKQVIVDSTSDIFGIDTRSTDVAFRTQGSQDEEKLRVQAQCTFFILGSGQVSMDLRRQLLDIANEKISLQLKNYGISFDIEDPTIYVDSPITI